MQLVAVEEEAEVMHLVVGIVVWADLSGGEQEVVGQVAEVVAEVGPVAVEVSVDLVAEVVVVVVPVVVGKKIYYAIQ